MTKTELIAKVAGQIEGATKKDITVVVDTLFETIKESIVDGEKVTISGFGTFDIAERAARDARNPRTGELLHVEAHKAPKFKPSQMFKKALNPEN
jgi:DNA-binding protein HU-beta